MSSDLETKCPRCNKSFLGNLCPFCLWDEAMEEWGVPDDVAEEFDPDIDTFEIGVSVNVRNLSKNPALVEATLAAIAFQARVKLLDLVESFKDR